MSSTNVMEVITRGSFEGTQGSSRPSSSSTFAARPESQLSLECLPPEEPHYGGLFQTMPRGEDPSVDDSYSPSDPRAWEGDQEGVTPTTELYYRVQRLSEQVKAELGHLKHTGPPDSTHPLPGFPEDQQELTVETESTPGSATNGDNTSSPLSECASSGEVRGHDTPGEVHERERSEQQYPQVADPKLSRALEKMRRLDAKLADLTKKEKEVKRQTKVLKQQSGHQEGGGDSMALVPMDVGSDSPPGTPVFATQLHENSSNAGDYPNSVPSPSEEGSGRGSGSGQEAVKDGHERRPKRKHRQEPTTGVDFIKRNIELAREAGMLIAMTEAEKKRLENLLADDTSSEEPPQPLQGIPSSTSGFSYNDQDLERMRSIDSRLQALMAPEDWQSLCSSRNTTPAAVSTEATDLEMAASPDGNLKELDAGMPLLPEGSSVKSMDVGASAGTDSRSKALEHIGPGEDVLQRFQMTREERQRLMEIDIRLRNMEEAKRTEGDEKAFLSRADLDALLEQCRSSTSEDYATVSSSSSSTGQYHTHVDSPEQ